MALVIDASVLAEYLVGSSLGVTAASLFHGDPAVHVPHLGIVETASVLRGWGLGGHLRSERARTALTDLADFPGTRWPAEPLLPRVWELRDNLSADDATYVALTEALDARLLTADARLARAIEGHAECDVQLLDPADFRGSGRST